MRKALLVAEMLALVALVATSAWHRTSISTTTTPLRTTEATVYSSTTTMKTSSIGKGQPLRRSISKSTRVISAWPPYSSVKLVTLRTNAQGFLQYDSSSDDVQFEGGSFEFVPRAERSVYGQTVEQAAVASD